MAVESKRCARRLYRTRMCGGRCAPHSAQARPRTAWARGAWRQDAYSGRNLLCGTTYSDAATPSVAYTYADSGKIAAATLSDGTSFSYGYDDRLLNTNESVAAGCEAFSVNRTYDGFRRASETAVAVTNVRHAAADGLPSPMAATYAYDLVGNATLAALASHTNRYAANGLNQYTSVLRVSAPPRETVPQYDADGNLVSLGPWAYAYDAANRLVSVSSNGMWLVSNAYDWRGRRVRKATPDATYTFFYDDWNLVEERISCTDGTTSTIRYYWGKDVSGTLQGAGGVGGLLYLTVDGSAYVPLYDANGNVTRYLDANGLTVAEYVYDAFGGTISKSGPFTDAFRFRFSTKYCDTETGLYYYGYRFYSPALMRWLTRDPIWEEGGENLYAFCGNDAVGQFDRLGQAHFEVRALRVPGMILPYSCFARIIGVIPSTLLDAGLADKLNIEILHEHLFYDDGTNVGYGRHKEFSETTKRGYHRRDPTEYDDCIMKEAQKRVPKPPYSLLGFGSPKYNCQDYASALRREYDKLLNDKEVKCKCKAGK